jgi:hypothetical protein
VTAATGNLEFSDDFRGPALDRSKWLPYYAPHWSSRAATAADATTGPDGLTLTIGPTQVPWLPEIDGSIRVSSIQTGEWAGPLGAKEGQHRFNPALRVREEQPTERLYVPHYGRFEMRARMDLRAGQLGALWMIGFEEDAPEQSGEITIMEIFGDSIDATSAELGHGIKAINDPALTTDFAAPRLAFSPAEFHVYAAQWDASGVSFYLDGNLLRRVEQSPDYPMQFMLNVYELKPGTGAPPRMTVDWFRGYSLG